MQIGELCEINNGAVHAVENRGDEDRIHLIIDWMPNYDGRPEEEVLVSDQVNGTDGDPADSETLNAMVAEAYQLHRSGQVPKAESIYRQVLDIDDSHVSCNNLLGLLCIQTKRFDQAVNYIKKALAEMPDDAQALSNLGLALKDLNRFEEAAAHFQKALLLVPNNPKTHNNLGNIYRELGRFDNAIASYQQALVIQPDYPQAHHNLGGAFLHLERFAEAVASLRQSLALKPDFAEARIDLGKALQGLRKPESAQHRHAQQES
jgi:tetratricopeptide (TPR) repeat protein